MVVAAYRGMPRTIVSAAIVAGLNSLTSPCWACPSCPIGVTAREQVWSSGFAQQLAIVLAPFLLLSALCVAVESVGARPDRKP